MRCVAIRATIARLLSLTPRGSFVRKEEGTLGKGCLTAIAIVIAIPVIWTFAEVYGRSDFERPNATAVDLNETPSNLVSSYSANEAAAKAAYSDATIRLIGQVSNVSLNATGGVIVNVSDQQATVSAHLLDSEKRWSESLSPGDSIKLICNDPYYLLGVVSLDHCVRD